MIIRSSSYGIGDLEHEVSKAYGGVDAESPPLALRCLLVLRVVFFEPLLHLHLQHLWSSLDVSDAPKTSLELEPDDKLPKPEPDKEDSDEDE